MAENNFKLTDDQRRSVQEIDRSVAILAGAGSGKTSVIVERIKNIVDSGNANLSEIVAITFTEKAAGELIYKITKEISTKFRPQIDLATITTIDGFCTKILREDASLLGINPDFEILEEHASRILNHRVATRQLGDLLRAGDSDAVRVVEEMGFRYATNCIEDLIDHRWYSLKWATSSLAKKSQTREDELERSLASCFSQITEKIDLEKKRLGVLDFVDLEILTLELLKNVEIAKKYQGRIRHLLIDEYQDTSDLQTEIIKHIYNPKKNRLCIVGDPGQSIYGFRGANPAGIMATKKLIEDNGGITIELKDNFRSTPQVIDYVNGLFKTDESNDNYFIPIRFGSNEIPNGKIARLDLGTIKGGVGEARIVEAAAIASFIKDEVEKGASHGSIAVLFRSFTDIEIFEKALNLAKVPFYRSGGRTFLKQPEITDIILCLKVTLDPTNDTFAYGLARSSIVSLSDEDCYSLFKDRKRPIFEILVEDPRFAFLKDLLKIKNYLSVGELIREIVRASHLHELYSTLTSTGQEGANIEKFISLSETISRQHDFTLEEFLEYVDDIKARGIGIGEPPLFGPHDDAVKLLTVHAAKGLEFEVVILADLARLDRNYALPYIIEKGEAVGFKLPKDSNPLADKEKTEEFTRILELEKEKEKAERERLLYVALTRAKKTLVLPYCGGLNYRSVWADVLMPGMGALESIRPSPQAGLAPSKVELAVFSTPLKSSDITKEMSLAVSQLESFHRCPQEYYLKYSLKIPAEKIVRPGKRMPANIVGNIVHKCIYISRGTNDPDWKNIIGVVSYEHGYPRPEKGDISKIERYLNIYKESEFFDSRLNESVHELPFVFKTKNATIRGTIDCIYKDTNGYSIVDFKTDRIGREDSLEDKVEEYRLQTLTYAMVAREALKSNISKMSLLFLDAKEAREIPLKKSDFEDGDDIIGGIINSIKNKDFGIDGKETPCLRCPYHQNKLCWLDKA